MPLLFIYSYGGLVLKLICTFEVVEMGDEIVYVPVGDKADEVHGVLRLNKEAFEIIKYLESDVSEEQIVNVLESKYENERSELEKYVHEVVTTLREAGLIKE